MRCEVILFIDTKLLICVMAGRFGMNKKESCDSVLFLEALQICVQVHLHSHITSVKLFDTWMICD